MRAAALARHLGVVPSTMSAAVKRLSALGYIARGRDARDRRAASLRLSPQGARAMQAGSVLETARVAAMLRRLSAADRARAIDGLELLAAAAPQPGCRRRWRMKCLLWIAVALVGLVGAVAVVGWLLPVGHVASRERASSPAGRRRLRARSATSTAYPAVVVRHLARRDAAGRAGVIRFREHMSSGPVVMEVRRGTAAVTFRHPHRRSRPAVRRHVDVRDRARAGSAHALTITERGEVYNPIFRFMSRFVFGYTGTMESCLAGDERAS